MKKTLKKAMIIIIFAVTICLSFVINSSAYSYVDQTVTITAYQGFTVTGSKVFSSNDYYWFAGRSNSPVAHWQGLQVQLYYRLSDSPIYILGGQKTYEDINGAYQNIYAECQTPRIFYMAYTYHVVKAYDCGNWYVYTGQTAKS